ncbi:hypothetical protein Pcinc_029183 [Petrolisthes cinctipes]|uniref:Cadherin domain-containing protein n=1 Tax=Petrolisthes cinctipes TaxID=88211 RepID=A0AAE1F1J3_PETCI|nr:hypothetical protein Pcinc_029183 [Petrolisthes cinctipes]
MKLRHSPLSNPGEVNPSPNNNTTDENVVKYFITVERSSRKCLEEIFTMLYRTWGRGKSYHTLQEFCEDCLGWPREQLASLLLQDFQPRPPSVHSTTKNGTMGTFSGSSVAWYPESVVLVPLPALSQKNIKRTERTAISHGVSTPDIHAAESCARKWISLLKGSEDTHTHSKSQLKGSEDTHTQSKSLLKGSEDKHTQSKSLLKGSEDKHIQSKSQVKGSEDKHTQFKSLLKGSEDKHTQSKSQVLKGSEDKHTQSKSQLKGSEDKHTQSKSQVLKGSEDKHTQSKSQLKGSEDKHTQSKSLQSLESDNPSPHQLSPRGHQKERSDEGTNTTTDHDNFLPKYHQHSTTHRTTGWENAACSPNYYQRCVHDVSSGISNATLSTTESCESVVVVDGNNALKTVSLESFSSVAGSMDKTQLILTESCESIASSTAHKIVLGESCDSVAAGSHISDHQEAKCHSMSKERGNKSLVESMTCQASTPLQEPHCKPSSSSTPTPLADRGVQSPGGNRVLSAPDTTKDIADTYIQNVDKSVMIPVSPSNNCLRGVLFDVESLLSREPNPSHLPRWALLLFITKVFPPLPNKTYHLLARLQRLYYVVCYQDLEYNPRHISLRVKVLSEVVRDLMAIISSDCKEIIVRFMSETSKKLNKAQRSLKKCLEDYAYSLDWVIKTRKDLKAAETDLHTTQDKSNEILRDYTRLLSCEPKDGTNDTKANISGIESCKSKVVGSNETGTINRSDSGNVSLADVIEGRDLDNVGEEVNRGASDGLFVSVMREVAVIQRRHSTLTSQRRFTKILRNTHKSVIQTKKEVRDRLESNVSAEEVTESSKEDIILQKKKITAKLTKEIKKLRREYRALETSEKANSDGDMVTPSPDTFQTLEVEGLDTNTLEKGVCGLQMVRDSEHGQILHNTRQEAKNFATRVRILDLGKWLMCRRYAANQITSVFSRLMLPDSDVSVSVLDVVGTREEDPSIIILSGPKGSGKSCICQYFLHQWQTNSNEHNSRLHEFDIVIYCTVENVLSSGSWSQYLTEHIFCLTLNDYSKSDINKVLGSMTVLFLLDVGVLTPEKRKVVRDVFSNLGDNRVVVTTRTDSESEMFNIAKEHSTKTLITKLCPMTYDAIEEYAAHIMSNVEEEPLAKTKALKFKKLVCSIKATEAVLYPLPIAYLLYVWREDPALALQSSSLSRLFAQVLFLSETNMMDPMMIESGGDTSTARGKVEHVSQQLCEAAWRVVTGTTWMYNDHILLEAGHNLLDSPLITTSFRSLIVIKEGMDGKQRGVLAHHSVAEILCGFYLGYLKASRSKGSSFLRRREKLDRYCVPDIKRFRHVLPHAAGALAYNKHNLEDTKEIASLYQNTLYDDRDMVSWRELLKECDYLPSMCTAVSGVLSRFASWTVAHHNQQTNCAVADLLRNGAYQPQLVVISQAMKGDMGGCSSYCVIHALSTCSSTLVHLRQETQFYSWGDKSTCDSLIVPLQPPGTLQECWGHLGVEGALALRHSHHLEELNVRISSCEALEALTQSIEQLRPGLKYLFLRLDITSSTPAACFCPLKFKGRKLWLKLRGVDDKSSNWAKQVAKRLSPWYTEVFARDDDGSAANQKVVFRIQHGAQDKFVMDADTGVISVAQGAVLDPDRTEPRATIYTLEVIALDGGIGTAQLQARTVVNITILDVNNKPPVFVNPGTVRVFENENSGLFVHRVEAEDLDARPRLRYYIDPFTSSARNEEGAIVKPSDYNYIEAFEMDSVEGVIRTVQSLDREQVEMIKLGLLCEDTEAATGGQTSTATLTIIVEDTNDNDPQFRKSYYRRNVAENAKKGTTIVTVVADDIDKNRTITYSLQGPAEILRLVSLDRETGEVVVLDRVDREQFSWLNFSVEAVDSGVPPRSSLVDVLVQVIDENDNNPVFVHPPTNLTIREDAPPGTQVALVNAVDPDADQYGLVTYLLDRKSSHGKFKIDPDTGIITVASPLNREEQSTYNLLIEAWDNYQFGYSSRESRNAFMQLGVTVADINDEAPVFEERDGCTMITEFHEPRATVTIVRAFDGDDPESPNGRIRLTIEGGNDKGLFDIRMIEPTAAQIFAAKPLVGKYGNYSLAVQAQDRGFPPNSVMAQVDICVSDFNDHAPEFVSPSVNLTIRVPENATVGSLVIQVRATDEDIGINGAVRYRILKDNLGNYQTFTIDQVTGAILLQKALDRERQKIYEIRVEAYDQGIPTPLSSDLDLTIYIRNVNDFQPQFLEDDVFVNFTEHKLPGAERTKLADTVDQDDIEEEKTAHVCYFIVGGDEFDNFNLDSMSHELMAVKELDREVEDHYTLIVKATEDCLTLPQPISFFNPADDTLLRVHIYVNDINDNPPKFTREVFTGGITTASDFGLEIMRLTAIDPDTGINSRLRYYMDGRVQETLSENLDNIRRSPFIVDPVSGVVKLNFDPQKGMKGYFDFKVYVNDSSGMSDRARVFIYLLREDQRVRFILRQSPDEVREQVEYFRDYLGNITGAIVNVDDFRVHENHDGTVDKTKTDLYLHLVDRSDNSVLEVKQVLAMIDENVEHLDHLFKELNVLDTQRAELITASAAEEDLLFLWLVGVIVFLTILLVLTVALCLSQKARYSRQLKAANATAFGECSHDPGVNRSSTVPNTNIHSVEGSNPIWMSGFDNDWYKDEDSLRYQHFVGDRDVPYITHSNVPNPLSRESSTVGSNTQLMNHEQQNINETYRANLYQTFHKIANPLVDKKLETTEL